MVLCYHVCWIWVRDAGGIDRYLQNARTLLQVRGLAAVDMLISLLIGGSNAKPLETPGCRILLRIILNHVDITLD